LGTKLGHRLTPGRPRVTPGRSENRKNGTAARPSRFRCGNKKKSFLAEKKLLKALRIITLRIIILYFVVQKVLLQVLKIPKFPVLDSIVCFKHFGSFWHL